MNGLSVATSADDERQSGGHAKFVHLRVHSAYSLSESTLRINELAELAALVREAEALGIDPWPPEKKERPWAKWALGSFMIVLMLSAVSKVLFRFVSIEG